MRKLKSALFVLAVGVCSNVVLAQDTCVAWDVYTGNCIQWSDDGGGSSGGSSSGNCVAWDVYTGNCIQWNTAHVSGPIRNQNGEPLANYPIVTKDKFGRAMIAYTGSDGRFSKLIHPQDSGACYSDADCSEGDACCDIKPNGGACAPWCDVIRRPTN